MKNRNIIIILVVGIVVLAAVIGFMLFNPSHNAKDPTKIKITSDKEQYKGGTLKLQLADLNKTPISKQIVNVTVTDKKGKVVVDEVVKTDSKGKAKLDLKLKKGNYKVNVTYGGNENHTGCNITQKLKIKEKVVKAQKTSSSSNGGSSEPSSWYDSEGAYHFYENGQEYVGDPNRQHMTVEQHNYVKEHGMGD